MTVLLVSHSVVPYKHMHLINTHHQRGIQKYSPTVRGVTHHRPPTQAPPPVPRQGPRPLLLAPAASPDSLPSSAIVGGWRLVLRSSFVPQPKPLLILSPNEKVEEHSHHVEAVFFTQDSRQCARCAPGPCPCTASYRAALPFHREGCRKSQLEPALMACHLSELLPSLLLFECSYH